MVSGEGDSHLQTRHTELAAPDSQKSLWLLLAWVDKRWRDEVAYHAPGSICFWRIGVRVYMDGVLGRRRCLC